MEPGQPHNSNEIKRFRIQNCGPINKSVHYLPKHQVPIGMRVTVPRRLLAWLWKERKRSTSQAADMADSGKWLYACSWTPKNTIKFNEHRWSEQFKMNRSIKGKHNAEEVGTIRENSNIRCILEFLFDSSQAWYTHKFRFFSPIKWNL